MRLLKAEGDSAVIGFPPQAEASVTPDRAASHHGFRFGDPVPSPTGEAESLTLQVEAASGPRKVTLVPGETARSEDLEISVEQYFPDFALDDQQRPFTRSLESRNPAALLEVKRGEKAFRVFVIRSLPGLHRVADLGTSFALVDVRPERAVRVHVAKEPFALLVATGALLLFAAASAALLERARAR
jgi:hypothetical protein